MSKKQSPERSSSYSKKAPLPGHCKTTLSTIAYDHKPEGKEAGQLQLFRNSKVMEVTPNKLGELLTTGYSFHPTVVHMGQGYSFRDASVLFQTVFAVDIDHHNFTVEEIIERCPIKPALIYKTFSYTEENKRYRVVFFANKSLSAKTCESFGKNVKEEIEAINIALTIPFLKGLPAEVVAFSDLSCINPARLYYGGTEVVHVDDSAIVDVFSLLRKSNRAEVMKEWDKVKYEVQLHKDRIKGLKQCREYLSDKEYEDIKRLEKVKTAEVYRFMVKLTEKLEKQGIDWRPQVGKKIKGKKAPKVKATLEQRPINRELIEDILDHLKDYNPDKIEYLDCKEATEFLGQIPWHELFGVELEEFTLAYLRFERNPSAVFFEAKNGSILYYDYGTQETRSGLSVLTEMMSVEYGTIFRSNLEMILNAMGIELGTKYYRDATLQVNEGKTWVSRLYKKELKHPAIEALGNGLAPLYVAFCNITLENIPHESLLANRQGVVIYRSYKQIHDELKLGVNGNLEVIRAKSYRTFIRKLNFLCMLGLIEKIHPRNLTPKTREGLREHKIKTLLETDISEDEYKEPNFYEIIPVTKELLDEVFEIYMYLNSRGITVTKASQKNIKAIKELKVIADTNYRQTNYDFSRNEKTFANLAIKQAVRTFNKQDYFIPEQLLKNMLKTDPWFNGTKKVTAAEIELDKWDEEKQRRIVKANAKLGAKRKKEMFKKVEVAILGGANAKRVKATPENLEKYKVTEKIDSRSYIYVKAK